MDFKKIDETCGCGARFFMVTDNYRHPEKEAAKWRMEHIHTEPKQAKKATDRAQELKFMRMLRWR